MEPENVIRCMTVERHFCLINNLNDCVIIKIVSGVLFNVVLIDLLIN